MGPLHQKTIFLFADKREYHGRLKNYRDGVERKKIEMEARILGLYEKKDHRS